MKRIMSVMGCAGILCAALFLSSCGSSQQAAKPEDDQQSEQDILRLLGVEGDGTSTGTGSMSDRDLQSRITELENLLMDKESEINELKAELVLKEERLNDMHAPAGMPSGPAPAMYGSFENQYNQALNTYRAGQYDQSIQQFKQLLSMSMTHDLSDNCQYWIGECYYGLKNYRQAIIEFEKVFTFSKSNKDDHAQMKLGLCYINIGDNEKARMEFNRLVTNYPKSDVIGMARQWLSRLP